MTEPRVIPPSARIPEIPGSVFLFRSCTGSLEYPGTEYAVRAVLERLGIEAVMDPDQTCCSGYLLTCSAYRPEVSLAVTARNLALVESKRLDTYTFCNGCFGYLSELAHLLRHSPGALEAANARIEPLGYCYKGLTSVFHVQEMWYRLRERLAGLVKRPLEGLRVGVHYGCHYLARQYGILDDGGYPTFHEEIVTLLGATPVFYRERHLCCGYAVGRGFTHREPVVQPHLYKKLSSARDAGVELITTVCPGCNVALDREQPSLAQRYGGLFAIPVIDLAQLIGLAIGLPVGRLGFAANTVPLGPVLAKLRVREA